MFCPECRAEYREGFYECSDCQVPLVSELPPKLTPERPAPVHLVTVLETGDPALIAPVKSLLEDGGIPYFARGEGVQDLLGLGRFGTDGFQVDRGDEKDAREKQ